MTSWARLKAGQSDKNLCDPSWGLLSSRSPGCLRFGLIPSDKTSNGRYSCAHSQHTDDTNRISLHISCCRAHGMDGAAAGVGFPLAAADICALSNGACRCSYCYLPVSARPGANARGNIGWADIPKNVQHLVLSRVPFKKLAKLAPVCKSAHTAWLARLTRREVAVDIILDGTWPEAVTRGLLPCDADLPRDLITPAAVLPVLCRLCCCHRPRHRRNLISVHSYRLHLYCSAPAHAKNPILTLPSHIGVSPVADVDQKGLDVLSDLPFAPLTSQNVYFLWTLDCSLSCQ